MTKKMESSGRANLSHLVLENRLVGNKYRLIREIGSGSFGVTYQGYNMQDGKDVAVKLEGIDVKIHLLSFEAKVYEQMGQHAGLPTLLHYGSEKDFNAMVMELLGPSLEALFNICKRRFTVKTILMLSDQMLSRVERVHQKGFIHRDIKPDNFLMGLGRHCSRLYIIDFGLAKRYRDRETNTHIPYREDRILTGTARYASINAQQGIEQSRRDDLESLSYCIMYFNMGKLPWQGIPAANKKQKYEKLMEIKRSICIDDICKTWPIEFGLFMKYVRNLRFLDEPDYVYLRQLFRILFRSLNHKFDHVFDWTPQPHATKDGDGDGDRVRPRREHQLVEIEVRRHRSSRPHATNSRLDSGDGLKQKKPYDKHSK
ncbi:casein kinase I [Drosophila grimshawi]|uniref:non-specific serine/threonine protein kinase n=1 Tax=Drosophila grimshawi TaxID=7222 RepID=B4JC93_DROGR|nr:casein kinase I [Drosophila grimshawi]EDW04126.1 GH10150 [Drosophila grimshawi]